MQKRNYRALLRAFSFKRSDCPLACALDLIGDKWSLLIVRDLLFGRSRFAEFLDAGEGISRAMLTTRLRELEKAGIVRPKSHPTRSALDSYELTESGMNLGPTIVALVQWSRANIPGTRPSQIG